MDLSKEFMEKVRPKVGLSMIRLGRKFDGGYVLPELVLSKCKVCISLGYGYDSSFEYDFLNISSENSVHLFDSDINLVYCLKGIFVDIVKILKMQRAYLMHRVKELIKYIILRTNPRIQYTVARIGAQTDLNTLSLNQLMFKQNSKSVLLKIDIEGSEYEILNHALENLSEVKCLIIEFHEIDTRMIEFLSILDLIMSEFILVNTHINNSGKIRLGIPSTLELCFIRKHLVNQEKLLAANEIPSKLDFPCRPQIPDIRFTF